MPSPLPTRTAPTAATTQAPAVARNGTRDDGDDGDDDAVALNGTQPAVVLNDDDSMCDNQSPQCFWLRIVRANKRGATTLREGFDRGVDAGPLGIFAIVAILAGIALCLAICVAATALSVGRGGGAAAGGRAGRPGAAPAASTATRNPIRGKKGRRTRGAAAAPAKTSWFGGSSTAPEAEDALDARVSSGQERSWGRSGREY